MAKAIYRYHADGFSGECSTLDELRGRVNCLNHSGVLTGKTLKIWKGTQHGDCSEYRSTPDREMVI